MMDQSHALLQQQHQQQHQQQQQQQQQPVYLHHQHHHQQQPDNSGQQFQQHVHMEQQQQQQQLGYFDTNMDLQLRQSQEDNINKELGRLEELSADAGNDLRICRQKGEELNLFLQQRNFLKSKLQPDNEHQQPPHPQQLHQMPDGSMVTTERLKQDKISCEESIRILMIELNEYREKIVRKQGNIIKHLSIVQNVILFELLPSWHQQQQLASNGPAGQANDTGGSLALDQLQVWIEIILSMTWRGRNVLKCLIQLMNNFFFEKYKHFYNEVNQLGLCLDKLLEAIILKSLIVEKQPPQVMKTNTRFASTVRFLGGDKLNLHMINPTVRVTILSEANARNVIQRHQEMIKSSWDLLEYDQLEASNMTPTQGPQGTQTSPVQAQFCNQSPALAYNNNNQQQQRQQTVIQTQTNQNQAQFFQHQHQQFYPANSPSQQQQHYQQPQAAPASASEAQPQAMEDTAGLVAQTPSISLPTQSSLKILNMSNFESSGEILNACNNLEYQESGQFVWQFRNMQLKKIKRTEKRGTESVMDEKFVLLFHAEFRIQEGTEPNCWSKTVVVIVHGNQEPHAVATVTWHNAFASPDGTLYYVPDKVNWPQLGHVLSEKFRAYAGKGLSQENLNYLAAKVSRDTSSGSSSSLTSTTTSNNQCEEQQQQSKEFLTVSWNQFAKETLPDKNFSFWEWFYSILKLTREHLAKLWEADRIYGFICKNTCSQLLLTRSHHNFIDSAPFGTFILRFSETELGGITIAWVSGIVQQIDRSTGGDVMMQQEVELSPSSMGQLQNSANGKLMMHIQPFLGKDLNTRSLADRIRDLDNLVYLYPDIPKDEAFGDHYTPIFEQVLSAANGYVRPMLITTLVENYNRSSTAASPAAMNSPNSFSQHSPTSEPIYQPKEPMNSSGANFNANFGAL